MRLTMELKGEFNQISHQLDPAELSQNGELDPQQVVTRRNSLNERWEQLEKQAGRKVTQAEALSWTDELNLWAQRQAQAAEPSRR